MQFMQINLTITTTTTDEFIFQIVYLNHQKKN